MLLKTCKITHTNTTLKDTKFNLIQQALCLYPQATPTKNKNNY